MLMRRFSILAVAILATAVALGSAMAQLERPSPHPQSTQSHHMPTPHMIDPIVTSAMR